MNIYTIKNLELLVSISTVLTLLLSIGGSIYQRVIKCVTYTFYHWWDCNAYITYIIAYKEGKHL